MMSPSGSFAVRSPPGVPVAPPPTSGVTPPALSLAFFTRALREGLGPEMRDVEVYAATPFTLAGGGGILTDLAARSGARAVGLFPFELAWRCGRKSGTSRVVIKSKADDREVIAVMDAMAKHCGEPIASLHAVHRFETGFRNCHLRELALGSFRDPAFTSIAIRTYTTWREEPCAANESPAYLLVLEHLDARVGVTHLDTACRPEAWRPVHVRRALRDLARFHGAFLDRADSLVDRLYLEPMNAARAERLAPLWDAIVLDNAAHMPRVYTAARVTKLRRAVAATHRLWRRLEHAEQTLVHNDFNPRNVCLRRGEDRRLCAYDWELATLHVPQRDVCDFLSYVLTPATPNVVRLGYVEHYRRELERACDRPIPRAPFFETYALASIDYALSRLGLLSVAHRFKRYPFLPRVLETHFRYLDTLGVEGGAPC